ncbi:hypothetical protein [Actinomyces gerencseriae]|uniref:hypothetical protein n=1 Tax=Actinomyces gerencseriae TaxID=52769 RepID=UPI0012EB36E3|nr:hypothetical protein [Actinomyces gerencseriae]
MTLAVVYDELRAARRAMEQCVDDLARVFPAHGSADAFGDDALASAASAWALSCREEAMAGRSAADGVVDALLSTADRLRRSDEEAADAATALGHRTPGAGGAASGLGIGGTRSMGGLR